MSQPSKMQLLSGWGRTPRAECRAFRPESTAQLVATIRKAPSLLAYGNGRSYGDAALNPGGVIRCERLKRLIAFDETSGLVTAEAGMTLDELLQFTIPRGWFIPVLPGTRYATLGGAAACNVHGKNHYRHGNLGRWIRGLDIELPVGQRVSCAPDRHADLFWGTIGGMGMSGMINTVTLQLMPITSLSLATETKRVDSLEAMVEAFYESVDQADYAVGWIDHFASGDALGRGVFERASHIGEEEGGTPLGEYAPPRQRLSVPSVMPGWLLNRYSMAVYNRLRFRRFHREWKKEIADFNGFFHPLDSLGHWNRLYGKRGFYQYQCVLPDGPNVAAQLGALLSSIRERGLLSYLAVLKYHGPTDESMLCFPMQGFSLALDFPARSDIHSQVHALNEQVIAQGGRVYLAKDALLDADQFARMYGDALPGWRALLKEVDPAARMDSLMARRLRFREDV